MVGYFFLSTFRNWRFILESLAYFIDEHLCLKFSSWKWLQTCLPLIPWVLVLSSPFFRWQCFSVQTQISWHPGSLFRQDPTDPSVSSRGLSDFWAAQHHNLSPLSGLKVVTVLRKCGAHNLCCLLSLLKYILLHIFRVCEVLWKPGHNG